MTLRKDELLTRAGSSLVRAMAAHFHIAMRALSRGDRRRAREHFQQASDLGMPPHYEWYWSRAFLGRLQESSAWPDWIK